MTRPVLRPPIDWTGKRFVNGAVVLRSGRRMTVGDRLLPGWVVKCVCGEEFERPSNDVGRSMAAGRAPRCPRCGNWRKPVGVSP